MAKASKRRFQWTDIVELDRALENVESDLYGDWYRDPWGWPELRWAVSDAPELVLERLDGTGVEAFAPIDVAKESFGTRPAIVMDPLDRLAYQCLVDAVSGDLIGDLRPGVFGWRLPRNDYTVGNYSDNGLEHSNFRKHLKRFAFHPEMYALKTDVVSCFANVDIDRLQELIQERSRSTAASARLNGMLEGWNRMPGRRGLPQRSAASAVLANLYLRPVDDEIMERPRTRRKRRTRESVFDLMRDLLNELGRGTAVRWMDDIWVLKTDPGTLRERQTAIEAILRSLGLDMNISKTDVLGGKDLWADVARITHSAVEAGLQADPQDTQPLEELLESMVEDPEHMSATTFRFACRRMRDHSLFEHVEQLAEVAHRAPHAADSLARLFRESGVYRELYSWYLKYWKGGWSTTDWSVAQLGTMFPSERTRKPLRERYAEEISIPGTSLALTSLAAERLASKDPDAYRSAIRASLQTADRPLVRRSLALAAVMSGEERSFVRRALGEFKANASTLRFLEETRFRPPKTIKDFSGNERFGLRTRRPRGRSTCPVGARGATRPPATHRALQPRWRSRRGS